MGLAAYVRKIADSSPLIRIVGFAPFLSITCSGCD